MAGISRLIGAAVAALFVACSARATEVVVHGVSRHVKRERDDGQPYVERNWGAAARWGAWQAGIYRNSWGRTSAYVVRDWIWPAGPVGVGVFAGAAVGYPFAALLPAAGFVVQSGPVRLRLVPPLGSKASGVAAVEFSWRLR